MDNKSGGIGITTVLTIIFVVLKLVGVIHWSWWLVLSPTLIALALGILVVLIGTTATIISNRRNR